MWKEIKFALYCMRLNLRNVMELRTSFILKLLGMALTDITFVVIWCLFANVVGNIGGWDAWDVVAMQGVNAFNLGVVITLAYGMMKLPDYLHNGSFDRFLVSPKNVLLRLSVSDMAVGSIGDILFGIITLSVYCIHGHPAFSQIALMISVCLITCVTVFAALLTIHATGFFFMDPRTGPDSLFEAFLTPSLFHGGAFRGWLRFFFIFIIPALLIGALPAEAIRHTSWSQVGFIALLTAIWLIFSIWFFYKGVRRYESANLTTFGT